MKKLGVVFLSLILLFNFCKKNNSEPTVEDKINVEITVNKDGEPVQGYYVTIYTLVKKYTLSRVEGSQTQGDFYTETEDETKLTNRYGKVTYSYVDKSVPEYDGVVVKKVEISYMNDLVYTDDEDKVVKKGKTLKLEYDI